MAFDAGLLDRLAAAFRSTAAHGREAVSVGPFQAWLHPRSEDPLMSLAVPVVRSAAWSPALQRLRQAFAARGRTPRLEFFREMHPELPHALAQAGVPCESVAPVMATTPRSFCPVPRGQDDHLHVLRPGDASGAERFLALVAAAFDIAVERVLTWKPQLLVGLREGTVRAAALVHEGLFVAGATLQVGTGAGELAGVGTLPARRREGRASDLCSRLLESWFDEGHDLCWLSAGGGAQGLYERLGFHVVGTQLNYGRSHPT
jgi:ribosomal protein S18 acetylase RimI-like enzyme